MAGDDALCLDVATEVFADALRYVAVAGSVEAVATYVILLVQLIRNGVEVSVVWHCAVEGVVEDADLRHVGHELVHGTQTLEVTCVVNGSEVAEALDAVLYRLVHDDALLEEVATLHDTVSHSVDLVEALDGTDLRIEEALEHEVDAFLVVRHVVHNLLLLAVGESHLNECLVEADTLNTACCQYGVVVHIVKLVLDGRTSTVKY